MYGSGFSPIPCMMETTIGTATAAVAVFEVTSDNTSVKHIMTKTVTRPPFNPICETAFPIATAAPESLIKVPAARPPAKT